jgi:DNA-directed RNA polymerase subunit beta'
VEKSGDTFFSDGEIVSRTKADRENERVVEQEGQPASLVPLVLGITRVALISESFISAASFQETLRVLTDAALMGMEDPLLGIKENVILGKIIPAGTGFFGKEKVKAPAADGGFSEIFHQPEPGPDPTPAAEN